MMASTAGREQQPSMEGPGPQSERRGTWVEMLPLRGDLRPWQVLERGHLQTLLEGHLGAHRTPH